MNTVFYSEIESLKDNYPKLIPVEKDGLTIIKGELDLVVEGSIIDSYLIEIHPVESYPLRFPYVYEVGGKIPRNLEWHIFETDGHCCIKNFPEEILLCKGGLTLLAFIEQQVLPYFFNQTYRRKRGYFLNERPHGHPGEVKFFEETLKTTDMLKLVRWLMFISNKQEPNRVAECFCGSGVKYRKCHLEAFVSLNRFTSHELNVFINRIIESNKFLINYPEWVLAYKANASDGLYER